MNKTLQSQGVLSLVFVAQGQGAVPYSNRKVVTPWTTEHGNISKILDHLDGANQSVADTSKTNVHYISVTICA